MAKIPDGSFKDWQDTQTVNALEYKRERELLRVANNDNDERLSSLEEATTALGLDQVQITKLTTDTGAPKLSVTDATKNLLAEIAALRVGVHTFYASSVVQGKPVTDSVRGFAHMTSVNPINGYVQAFDANGNIYTNYVENATWKGWSRFVKASELPTDTDWAKLTLNTGLVPYATGTDLRWKRVSGIVYLSGAFKGDLDWDEVIATLPVGARPTYPHPFLMPTSMDPGKIGRNARYEIGTDGKITFIGTNDGMLYTEHWFPINTSFPV